MCACLLSLRLCRGYLIRDVFQQMRLDGVRPSGDDLGAALGAAASAGRVGDALWCWRELSRRGCRASARHCEALLAALAKRGLADEAARAFSEMARRGPRPGARARLELLRAFAAAGREREALGAFEHARRVSPRDPKIYTAVLGLLRSVPPARMAPERAQAFAFEVLDAARRALAGGPGGVGGEPDQDLPGGREDGSGAGQDLRELQELKELGGENAGKNGTTRSRGASEPEKAAEPSEGAVFVSDASSVSGGPSSPPPFSSSSSSSSSSWHLALAAVYLEALRGLERRGLFSQALPILRELETSFPPAADDATAHANATRIFLALSLGLQTRPRGKELSRAISKGLREGDDFARELERARQHVLAGNELLEIEDDDRECDENDGEGTWGSEGCWPSACRPVTKTGSLEVLSEEGQLSLLDGGEEGDAEERTEKEGTKKGRRGAVLEDREDRGSSSEGWQGSNDEVQEPESGAEASGSKSEAESKRLGLGSGSASEALSPPSRETRLRKLSRLSARAAIRARLFAQHVDVDLWEEAAHRMQRAIDEGALWSPGMAADAMRAGLELGACGVPDARLVAHAAVDGLRALDLFFDTETLSDLLARAAAPRFGDLALAHRLWSLAALEGRHPRAEAAERYLRALATRAPQERARMLEVIAVLGGEKGGGKAALVRQRLVNHLQARIEREVEQGAGWGELQRNAPRET